MADLERNRQLVIQLWDALCRQDLDAAGARFAPDGRLEHLASRWVEQV